MFIHPPMQMAGLVSVALPFSIAMGALMAGRGGRDEWVDLGRIWGMVSWLILTIGLLLGSWWAYTILGWGGYWAWDPVENSALMPWLAMTAFVHSIMVQKRRGMFRMWNIVLVTVAFTLAQMGMFINRGGPVPSVHSFGQSTMGWLFLVFMGATLLGSLAVFAWRSGSLKSRERLDSILSRESAFLTQNVLFLSVAMVTLWGTIYPVISEATQGLTITVGRPFFDRVNGPLLLVLVFLMGVGPLLPWRRASARNVLYALWYPLGSAAIGVVLLVVIGVSQPVALMALAVIIMGIGGIVHEWVRGTRSRIRNGESYPVAFTRLLAANRPRYGGYIVHLSIAMLAVGAIGSSFYDMQRDIPMSPGDTRSLGGYSFTYLGVSERSFSDRDEGMARFAVTSGDRDLGIMSTTRTFYRDFRIAATRAAIRSTPLEDFYIVPSEFGEDGQTVFRVYVNPLVWWMWASGPLLALGTLLAVSPRRRLAPAPVTGPDGMGLARV
jgi:cytochrome c-type biogenesis protein CcmF